MLLELKAKLLLFHSHGCWVSFAFVVKKTPRILTRIYNCLLVFNMEADLCRMARYSNMNQNARAATAKICYSQESKQ